MVRRTEPLFLLPHLFVTPNHSLWHVRQIPFRSPIVDPSHYGTDLFFTESPVILEILDSITSVVVVRGHQSSCDLVFDPPSVTPNIAVLHERHWCYRRRTVTNLAVLLDNRCDVTCVCDVLIRACLLR